MTDRHECLSLRTSFPLLNCFKCCAYSPEDEHPGSPALRDGTLAHISAAEGRGYRVVHDLVKPPLKDAKALIDLFLAGLRLILIKHRIGPG